MKTHNSGGVAFAAAFLNYSKSSIYKFAAAGKIPAHRIPGSKKLIFFESDLETLLRAGSNENGGVK